MNMKKIALVFPGIGYHIDKPLLYYSRRMAEEMGFRVVPVPYRGFSSGIKGSEKKMKKALDSALKQTEEILDPDELSGADRILCLSKSIGTAAAERYAVRHSLRIQHVMYTPLVMTFDQLASGSRIAFHGTGDPWADTASITECARKTGTPLFLTPGANHSLEIRDELQNIRNLMEAMKETYRFIFQNDC